MNCDMIVSISSTMVSLNEGKAPSTTGLSSSISMPDRNDLVINDVLGIISSSWSPNPLSRSLFGKLYAHIPGRSAFTIAINVLKAQFIQLRRRIHSVEAENDNLKHANRMCQSDVSALNEELTNLRMNYYEELDQRRQLIITSKEEIMTLILASQNDKEEIKTLKIKIAEANTFIQAMVEVKFREPVFSRAAQALKIGFGAEEALVNSIMAASTREGSAWSRIIPAVVGPRSADRYLSAVTLALKARKELHDRQKASKFWKHKVSKMDPSDTNNVTPSPSELSDICAEILYEMERPPLPATLDNKLAATMEYGVATPRDVKSDLSVVHRPVTAFGEPPRPDIYSQHKAPLHTQAGMESSDLLNIKAESVKTIKPLPISQLGHRRQLAEIDSILYEVEERKESNVEATTPPTQQFVRMPVHQAKSAPSSDTSQGTSPLTPRKYLLGSNIPVTPPRVKYSSLEVASPKSSASHPGILASPLKTNIAGSTSEFSEPRSKLKTSIPPSPIRSRLSTPRTNTFKRPVLQKIDLNVSENVDQGSSKATPIASQSKVFENQRLWKPLAKDLRKRRGVIMVEKDLIPGFNPVKKTIIVPRRDKVELYHPPTFPISADVFGMDADCNSEGAGDSENECKDEIDRDEEKTSRIRGAGDATEIRLSPNLAEPALLETPRQLGYSRISSSRGNFGHHPETDIKGLVMPSPTVLAVSQLAASFSNSDFGSLEMTDGDDSNSDSNCEDIRMAFEEDADNMPRNLSDLPHIRRALVEEVGGSETVRESVDSDEKHGPFFGVDNDDDFGSQATPMSTSAVASAFVSGSHLVSRPATPIPKSLSFLSYPKDCEALSRSTSASSCTAMSSSCSSGSDKPSAEQNPKGPLSDIRGWLVETAYISPSPTPTKKQDSESILHIRCKVPSQPPGSIKPSSLATPRAATSKSSNGRSKASTKARKRASLEIIPKPNPKPAKRVSPPNQKSLHVPLLLQSKSNSSPPHLHPTTESKASVGRNIMPSPSNMPSPSKPKPVVVQHTKTRPTYLAPPPHHQTKRRSHTINTKSPLPPALSTPSPESLIAVTKPRSNTFNSYLPSTRSPLSRLVTDISAGPRSQSNSTTRKPSHSRYRPPPPPPSPPKSLAPKPPSSFSKASSPIAKPTLPLRINKKTSSTNLLEPQSTSCDNEPGPPTAAFMRPAASRSASNSATRRMTNSIAPLIPNWTPSSKDGVITPVQCRNMMFKNSLSMVVR